MSMTRHWKRSSQIAERRGEGRQKENEKCEALALKQPAVHAIAPGQVQGIAVSVKVCMQATLVVDVAFGIKCCIGALVGGLGAQSGALSEALVH
eukprot:scaffold285157_cov14-Tisochrysis_lutea.AAC.2